MKNIVIILFMDVSQTNLLLLVTMMTTTNPITNMVIGIATMTPTKSPDRENEKKTVKF